MQKSNSIHLKTKFSSIKDQYHILEGKRQALASTFEKSQAEIVELDDMLVELDKCLNVFEVLISSKKEEIKRRIESLVTQGLQTIFERPDYKFSIGMEIKRGVMTASPMVHSLFQGEEFIGEPIESHGGGLCDVISFLLQVIVLLAFGQKLERILICDEVFKHVSRQFLPNVSEFLTYLTEKTGLQLILVTHQQELMNVADKCFEVRLNQKNETVIKEINKGEEI